MEQSVAAPAADGLHVAIIMDGNGRWGVERGLDRSAGHRAGAKALQRVVRSAPGLGVRTLTVYAFSADNWKRPAAEVAGLMRLFGSQLARAARSESWAGVRVSFIGRRDRLTPPLAALLGRVEAATAGGARLHLRVAIDYSGREAILRAAQALTERPDGPDALARRLSGDVDLLIRTGGEQRLSDFLLWESAYAELYFTERLWPDFGPEALEAALGAYRRRERRFGGLGSTRRESGLAAPSALAFDGADALLADGVGQRLWRLKPCGERLPAAVGLDTPVALRRDAAGRVHVLERSPRRQRLSRLGPAGTDTVYLAPDDVNLLDFALLDDGAACVALASDRVIVARLDGGQATTLFELPAGPATVAIAADGAGGLYVLHDEALWRWRACAGLQRLADCPGLAPSFDEPGCLIADARGAVACASAHGVWRFEGGRARRLEDAGCAWPHSPAFDASGALWVVEGGSGRLWRLEGGQA